ncbi:unnamed protein product [Rotaria sp. Silwood2]|nr:unnamed protein product [Rotaria sp. Silwood2]
MINTLTVTKPRIPRPFLRGLLHLRLRLLNEHKKILASLLEYNGSQVKQHYQRLRELKCPALIMWGQQDKV